MKPQCMRPYSLLTSQPPLWLALSLVLLLTVQPALAVAAQTPAAPAVSDADLPSELQEALRRVEELTIDESAISVEAKAKALGGEIGDLFAFVRDEIRFEPYRFLLRGPEGTLVAGAGNSVDQAYLLEALCRHNKLRCRVVQGTLTDEQAGSLIASLFSGPVPAELLEGIPKDAPKADPTRDPELLAEVRDHYWVQCFDQETRTWIDLDPTIGESPPGRAAIEASRIVSETPAQLSPKLSLAVHLEEIRDGKALHSTPLEFEESWSALVLKPVHLMNLFVSVPKGDSVALTTYQPVLLVGDRVIEGDILGTRLDAPGATGLIDRTASLLEAVGEDEKETATLVLSREWLELTLRYPDNRLESWTHEVFTEAEDISRWSAILVTLHLSGGGETLGLLQSSYQRLVEAHVRAYEFSSQLDYEVPTDSSASVDLTEYAKATDSVLEALMVTNRHAALAHTYRSNGYLEASSDRARVSGYHAEPRVLVASSRVGASGIGLSLDLARNRVRFLLPPGTPQALRLQLHWARGTWEVGLEEMILKDLTGMRALGAAAVLAEADAQGIPLVVFSNDRAASLDDSPYSSIAKRNMRDSLARGNIVLVPERMVTFDGQLTIAWWELDRQTAEPISVSENGQRQARVEYPIVRLFLKTVVGSFVMWMVSVPAGFLLVSIWAGILGETWAMWTWQAACGPSCSAAKVICKLYGIRVDIGTVGILWALYGLSGWPYFSAERGCNKGATAAFAMVGCGCP